MSQEKQQVLEAAFNAVFPCRTETLDTGVYIVGTEVIIKGRKATGATVHRISHVVKTISRMVAVSEAMSYAHSQGIVRDVVLIGTTESVRTYKRYPKA